LLSADQEQAAEVARQILEDKGVSPALRRDAFCVLLCSQAPQARSQLALDRLANPDAGIRNLALATLTGLEDPPYQTLRQGKVRLPLPEGESSSRQVRNQNQTPIVAEAPKGLQAAMLRPLLTDSDPTTVAYAGYLLALLGEPEGLEPLLRHWREHERKTESWMRLVYRAVSALGDDANVPLLEEIYRAMASDDSSNLRDFYWTIRVLDGPNALRLRKQMRQEVGMEKLQ
jgi:hypothetical protein